MAIRLPPEKPGQGRRILSRRDWPPII